MSRNQLFIKLFAKITFCAAIAKNYVINVEKERNVQRQKMPGLKPGTI